MPDGEFIEHVCDHSDRSAWNCMTLIAGKNATTTGQVLVAHNEDDDVYCKVYRGDVPQMNWQAGSVIPAENGRALIPQIEHTHGYLWVEVKAGMYGLSNADTYFNDAGILIVSNSCKVSKENTRDPSRLSNGGIEGNLRRIVAERASTAREALRIAIEMVDTYGYAPDGRSYTFADKNEAFMIQIVSGRHYMAVRIPDDMVAVMPNHYTLHGLNDFPEAYYSPDLVEYAIEKGWYKPRQDGSFEDFDFAKVYAIEEKQHQPYNVLRAKHALQKLMHQKCGNTTNDLPFVCRPNHKVSPRELGNIMSEHYEGTPDDAERVGPGRSPHYSSIRRICTGSTVDSIVCEFSNEALFTKIWTCLGRPCQLPYMPTHPAAGLPKALNSMEKPVERAAKHYLSAPEEMGYSRSVWQRFRDYQNAMDLLYCDTADDGRKLLSDLWNADCEAIARAENEARSLIRCGKVENALTLLRETDNLRICKDLDALEMFASQKTRRIDAAPVYLESNQKKSITVTFSCPFEPVEESLIFGLSGRSTSANFACCQQGTLRKHTSGQYTADFSLELLKPDLCAAASFACLLGGTDTTGIPFVGQVMLSLPKTGANRMCVMADTLRDKNGCKMK